MSSPIKNVIIAGAGGNLGAPALKAFLDSPLSVSVLTREDSKSTFPSNVNVIKTDYSKESLITALKGQDAVVCFLATTSLASVQGVLLDAAIEAGVKRFIPSEFGHNTGSPKLVELIPLFGSKAKFIEQVKAQPSITWTAVITGLFFDWGISNTFIGVDLKAGKATVWDDGSVPFSTTNTALIGKTLVKVLTDPAAYEDSENKYIYLASHTTSQAELVAASEKVLGKKFEVTTINGSQTFEENREKLSKGDFSAVLPLLKAVAFAKIDGAALADFREFGVFNDKHGVKDISLEEDLKRLANAQ